MFSNSKELIFLITIHVVTAGCGGRSSQDIAGKRQADATEKPVATATVSDSACVKCHMTTTANIPRDFLAGKMGREQLDCSDCHGSTHSSSDDAKNAVLPTEVDCGGCHDERLEQYMAGKHAKAWVAMSDLPMTSIQPHPYIQDKKGCGGCHKMGVRDAASRAEGRYGMPCNNCHTRHAFSQAEARRPEACRTCHMGFDHPQWEMWSSSKHGVIYLSGDNRKRAPTCQTCHMPGGDHGVKTSWGFFALRLPEEDPEWLADRTTILKALRVLDEQGNPTPRFEMVKSRDMVRLSTEEFVGLREKMLAVCGNCHSSAFAKTQLDAADQMVREADKLMAEAIDIVVELRRQGALTPLADGSFYPDLLNFYDTATDIEQTLWVMFLEHRMRTFQGAFHMNPDYVTWYGFAEMKRDLVHIKHEASRLRMMHRKPAARSR